MALSKKIQMDNGAVAEYFNVAGISWFKGGSCNVTVNWYGSNEIRLKNPDATLCKNEVEFPADSGLSLSEVYAKLKDHPSGVFSDAVDA